MDEARALLKEIIVWDNVWPWSPDVGNDFDKMPVFVANGWSHVSMTVAGDNYNSSQALARIATVRAKIHADDNLMFVEKTADIRAAKAANKLAVSLHLEGTRCFERNLDLVDAYYCLGIRHSLIAFNNANSAGGGCAEPDAGLTKFGRRLVREMERVGMLLDLSHTGYKTTMDAIEMSTKPVIFSHSNADAVAPHWRNLKDDQIKGCAASGGLVGVSGSSGYLGDDNASTEAVFRHVDYFVSLVGEDHVGIGFDIVFDDVALNAWVKERPDEWPGTDSPDWPGFHYIQPPQLLELVQMMLDRGYSREVIKKICGENYMRICSAVWVE